MTNRLLRLLKFHPPPASTAARGPVDRVRELRQSPSYRKLLAEFVLPNAPDRVARDPHWTGVFDRPVPEILRSLKGGGILVEPGDARARLHFARDSSDLRVVCVELGLPTGGSDDDMVDRLLRLDPTGLLLGYPGELLQCADFVKRAVVADLPPPRAIPVADPDLAEMFTQADYDAQREWIWGRTAREPSPDQVLWALLQARAQATARAGNLSLCRDAFLGMTRYLIRREKWLSAFKANCIVCIFDLSGARNRSDAPAAERPAYSRYDERLAFLEPAAIRRAKKLRLELALPMPVVGRMFLQMYAVVRPPGEPEKLWAVFRDALLGPVDPAGLREGGKPE